MFSQNLTEFRIKNNITSLDKWADETGVSKSTINRALKDKGKNMGIYTLLALINPYHGSIDELLGIGAYSPEAIEKEEIKNDMVEKIENVIDKIENSDELPHQPSQEIKEALTEVQEFITSSPVEQTKCINCTTLREIIDDLKEDKTTKNRWIINTFRTSFVLLIIVLLMIVINIILVMSLVNVLG